MNAELAQECVRRLICSVLRQTGFDASSPDALVELEDKLTALLGGLLHIAHDYAELARRTRPVPLDFMKACSNQGISTSEIADMVDTNRAEDMKGLDQLRLQASTSTASPADADVTKLFLSDSDLDTQRRASYAPDFLPFLPPSHSYMKTPVYTSIAPPELAARAGIPIVDMSKALEFNAHQDIEGLSADARITQLDARIRTTRLVEASLQNLIRATSKGQKRKDGIDYDPNGELSDATAVLPKDQLLAFLKKYERDAAVCNFEIEWYAAGGGTTDIADNETKARATNRPAPRKRGKWKT